MRSAFRTVGFIAALLTGSTLAGCTSDWSDNFQPARGFIAADLGGAVIVREAPFERIQAALDELHAEWVASDTHPDDWAPQRRQFASEKMLRALQLPADAATYQILGRSVFTSIEDIAPSDGELASFAQDIGADYAIWSRQYVGQRDTIVHEPVTTHGRRSYLYYDEAKRKWRTDSRSDSSTTYVPIVVSADEHAFIAYYIRKR